MMQPGRSRSSPRYCILGYEEISAQRAHGGRARVSVNFRKFSPCFARAAKQKYQNGSIHRKLKVSTSMFFHTQVYSIVFKKYCMCE